MIRLFFLSSFFFLTGICFAQQEGKIMIYGQIDTVPGSIYELSYLDGKNNSFEDTITIGSDGKFEYELSSNEPLAIYLSIDNVPGKPWYEDDRVGPFTAYSFWAEPGKRTYFRGLGNQKQLVENSETDSIDQSFDNELAELLDSKHHSTRSKLVDSLNKEYLKKAPTYYTVVILNAMLKWRTGDPDYVEEVYNKLPLDLKQTPRGQRIKEQLFVAKNTSIGKVMPDFEIQDESGKPVGLKGFRGKYVLVDFWASWCAPCRKEHPHLIEAYNQYRDKGFEILGVSLDEERKDWLKAIKDDGLLWTQVSDLKAFKGEVVSRFFIHSIPDNYLLDPQGVIIAKGLRGKELLEILETLPLNN